MCHFRVLCAYDDVRGLDVVAGLVNLDGARRDLGVCLAVLGIDVRSELACAGEYAVSSDAVEVVSGRVVFGTCEGTRGGASI